MHTIDNTNIDIIRKKYRDFPVNNCVLIITGSFNPIHRSHIKNLKIVKKYLEENTPQQHVLASYLSPTEDGYVRGKLGSEDWISADDRCKLCEDAITEENLCDDISVATGECKANTFVDFDQVTIEFERFLNRRLYESEKLLKNPLTVVYVCGLDHFNKCSYVETLAMRENIACAVVYRPGATENRIRRLTKSSKVYYIPLEDEHDTGIDISSTAIREKFHNGKDRDLIKLTYNCVIKFLQNKYNKNQERL